MKVAVSSKGDSLDSQVDPRFGRCSGFIIFDDETGDSTWLDNSAQRDSNKATGVKAAKMISDAGAEKLITGQMGPKAAQVLQKNAIKTYDCQLGSVREALGALKADKLSELSNDRIKPGPAKMGGQGRGGGGRGGPLSGKFGRR